MGGQKYVMENRLLMYTLIIVAGLALGFAFGFLT
jgi:hypothetical protein